MNLDGCGATRQECHKTCRPLIFISLPNTITKNTKTSQFTRKGYLATLKTQTKGKAAGNGFLRVRFQVKISQFIYGHRCSICEIPRLRCLLTITQELTRPIQTSRKWAKA